MILKIVLSTLLLLFLLGCESYNDKDNAPSVVGAISDYEPWYSDMNDDLLEMRVSIPIPNEYNCPPYDNTTAPSRPCTLADIDGDTDANDDYEPLLHVQMQTDTFISPDEVMNAAFEQKGKSTRNATQKSYRIKLDSSDALFNGERTFQLNKHPYDDSRVRNKLAFDIFRTIPNFTSLKTQFVQLYINEVDYGLFTHIEKMGKEFLLNRKWDEDDNLYKAQNFGFRMSDALLLDSSGNPIDQEAFDAVIEIERGKDQYKLVAMIEEIEATQSDAEFESKFAKYFNRENYITWMAINLVMANKDTVSQNFYLYNPKDSDTFYFMPWDYDGSGRETSKYARWELGIGTWWGIPLHKRFLRIEKNREDLDTMVTLLRSQYVTPEIIQSRLDIYRPLIEPMLSATPDSLSLTLSNWESEFGILTTRLDENIQNYRDQIGSPMPFWQSFSYEDGNLTLKWDESVDFEGDEIVYDVLCADNIDFNNSIINESNLSVTGGKLSVESWGETSYSKSVTLAAGHYFMKIVAKEREDESHYQIAFDKEVQIDSVTYFGVLEFVIE